MEPFNALLLSPHGHRFLGFMITTTPLLSRKMFCLTDYNFKWEPRMRGHGAWFTYYDEFSSNGELYGSDMGDKV